MKQKKTVKKLLGVLFSALMLCSVLLTAGAMEVEHAEGFSVDRVGDYTVVRVSRLWEENGSESVYCLVSRTYEKSDEEILKDVRGKLSSREEIQLIRTPVTSFGALSTTYLYPLAELGEVDSLVAVDKHDYVYNREVRGLIEEGDVAEVGDGPTIDLEKIVALDPELVMATGVAGEWNTAERLEKADVPVVVNADYLEKTPLARAEWIKFISLFFEKGEQAARAFDRIEKEYGELKKQAADKEDRPSVLLNRPMQGRWVLPGGESYMAHFLEDAGADYMLSSDKSDASVTRDVEWVYKEALEEEFWLHQYGWESLEDVRQNDQRLTELRSFREENLVNNDARVNKGGGNDFYESGPYRPHIILADLVKIFHPSLLPEHSLHYYRYLE
ncbi:MAG: ABC transporter substrate-binding protein [Spirochaetaceae bacterium]